MIPQRLTNREIAMDLGLIFGCQRIGPAIAKLFRLFINTGSAARVERRHLIGLAIDADKRRVIFPANWASLGKVIGELRNEIFGPDAVFPLVTLEGRERDDLACAHCPRALLRPRRNRPALLRDIDELTARGVEEVEHIGAAPAVHVAECGVFKGSSLATIALYLRDNRLAKHVFGLDSFQGFDESVEKDIALGGAADAEKRVGGFEATSLARVRAKLAGLGLVDAVTLIPGYFVETLEKLVREKV
jgi:hypothetical protein